MTLYQYPLHGLNGQDINLADFQDKVLLLVNTASACGFTPQYAELEQLHRQFADEGLVVIGFPCNQFGAQEPGSAAEIGAFCQKNYGVSFLLSEKIDVNGPQAHPLWQYLKQQQAGVLGSRNIKWNFTKFLVDRHGRVVGRYGSITKPQALAEHIKALL
ncbi:glutathione peroxidase [Vogesella sp. GCM10023246]|uniref:Glutathione peroxidase n=1 Tax=Vogesella oryzagri TaxID=3160864 RepID=A0ABV1M1U0_9NEIS